MAGEMSDATVKEDPVPPEELIDDSVDDDAAAETKTVPLKALKESRAQTKAAKEQAKAAEAKAKNWDVVAPYVHLLSTHPDIVGVGKKVNDDAVVDAEAEEHARELGLLTPDGNLDIAKARRILDRETRRASEVAARAVQPVTQQTQHQKAAAIRERSLRATDDDGNLFAKKEFIDHFFNNTPDAVLDENMAVLLLQAARGAGGAGEAPPSGPIHTESVGRRSVTRTEPMTPFDEAIMRNRGIKSDKWQKTLTRVELGILEDE